ncbi:MAG: cyclic nucleotide-binding domain-containing protein [Cyanobacteria bacterium SBLK]|nr:cyclic nucleotide-binding domain-containing protein [Cyanobacteria bacterium SBLK]
MYVEELYEVLKQTNIGKNLSLEEVTQLREVGNLVNFKANDTLMRQGDESNSILVLLHGEAEILKESENTSPKHIRDVGRGDVLGELGVIMQTPRSCTIRAKTATMAFAIARSAFEKLMADGSSIGNKLSVHIARVIGNRMQLLTNEVFNLLQQNDSLLDSIEKLRNSSSQQELEQLRLTLLERAEKLRHNNLKVKKQLFNLNSEIKQATIARKGAQFMVLMAVGGFMALIGAYLLGVYYRTTPELSDNLSHPTVIPYANDPETCEKRSGSYWIEGQCWDYEHSREF